MLIAYLMRARHWGLDEAMAFVGEKRRIRPNQNFREQLGVWEATGYEIWEDAAGTVPKSAYATFLESRAERLEERGLTGDEPIGPQSLLSFRRPS